MTENYLMQSNRCSCILHLPEAKKRSYKHGNIKEEISQSLPESNPQIVYNVDDYEDCPANWLHGSEKASSYFVAVEEGKGLWLDFNANKYLDNDVAIVISIQGINPITGQPTRELRLEQYRNNCPKHNIPFESERFCKECGYKWDAQNYLASICTPSPYLWLDGFRTEDGTVRQYVFTKDNKKGVANQIIGEDRVFAIGIAFYLSKEVKPKQPSASILIYNYPTWYFPYYYAPYAYPYPLEKYSYSAPKGISSDNISLISNYNNIDKEGKTSGNICYNSGEIFGVSASCISSNEPIGRGIDKLEIAAGAKIDQRIYIDSQELDFYRTEPSAMIYINYCNKYELKKILSKGKKDRTAKGEGFLKDLETVE